MVSERIPRSTRASLAQRAQGEEVATDASSKRGTWSKQVTEDDEADLFDIPDSTISSSSSTPLAKRRRIAVEIPTPNSDTPRGSTSPSLRQLDTPASSLSDDESHSNGKLTTRRSSRKAAVVAKRKSFKVESESELSEIDDISLVDPYVVTRPSVAKSAHARHISAEVAAVADDDDDDDDEDYKVEREGTVSDVESEAIPADYVEGDIDQADTVNASSSRRQPRSIEDDSDEHEAVVAPRGRARRTRQPRKSRYETTMTALLEFHPELGTVWSDLEAMGVTTPTKAEQPAILTLKLLPFQLEGLHWLRKQEQSDFRGGILADEMGMGKTIQTVSMLVSDTSRNKSGGEAGTLIVAPTVALMQWRSEISLYTNNALSIYIYHGSNRELSKDKLQEFDIILTTYNLLESVWRKQQSGFRRKNGVVKEKSLLHSIKFHRIVLDEAHNIKDRSCGTARAVFNLQTDRRWCLSGTPLQNRVGELFSLLRFLQADPFSYYYCKKCPCKSLHWKFTGGRQCDECGHTPMAHTCWFNHELLKPIQAFGAQGEGLTAFKKIHALLRRLMLRRTKVERADDMGLPPRVVTIRRDMFNDEEEDLYQSLYTDSRRKFNTYAEEGTVLNNYANIFQLITRMRQMADHPDLILRREAQGGQNSIVCRLCDDVSEDAIKAKCHHIFCRSCVQDYQESFVGPTPDCPVCHLALNIDLTAPALEMANQDLIKRNSILNRIDMSKWRSSSKIEALVEELYKLRAKDSSIKSIVFSQWTSFLELVNWRLRRAGFNCVKLDGSMTPEARANTIEKFSTDPQVTVFLVSLKAGGVALNLTEASVVFLSDPWWNPSAEWQAADRVHRLGQHRPVRITRLVIENSIESKIVDLQEKKANMINSTIDADPSSLNRLSVEDMSFLFQS